MDTELRQVIYHSVCAEWRDPVEDLHDVLVVSKRNNPIGGITGALAAYENRFLQVMEGHPDDVERLLDRLNRDIRHRDILVLADRRLQQRMFAHWSMANAEVTSALAPAIARVFEDPYADADQVCALLLKALSRPPSPGTASNP